MLDDGPALPQARGEFSESILGALRNSSRVARLPTRFDGDALADDDLQLALWCCYQLHYESFENVDGRWEWDPDLLAARQVLEGLFVDRLVDEVGPPANISPADVVPGLRAMAEGGGPSLSTYVLERGTRAQVREFLVHRSAYQRKEADPHTWAIPRLQGRAKAAMVAIQYDEYGCGRAGDMHAELFADTMEEFGLDPGVGAYVDRLPGTTLATDNLVAMFGLHRRWRAACVGHLALFEMTSVLPMARYSRALSRLGAGDRARRFYDVHVEADSVHELVAQHDLVAGLLKSAPQTAGTVLFGARCLNLVEARFAGHLLRSWHTGRSSLLAPVHGSTRQATSPVPGGDLGAERLERVVVGVRGGRRLGRVASACRTRPRRYSGWSRALRRVLQEVRGAGQRGS